MSRAQDLLAWFRGRERDTLDLLGRLVAIDSPTSDKAGVDRVAALVAGELERAGARVTPIRRATAGDSLRAAFGPPDDGGGAGAMLLGHIDTVWPLGEAARRPFAVEGGLARGPGVFDMKAGVALVVMLARAARDGALAPRRPVTVFLSGDEETGSPTARLHIESEARRCRYVLGLEPCNPDGGAKTRRKGVGRALLQVGGRAAHAGIDPERGVNAVEEMAHQVLAVRALAAATPGAAIQPGLVRGGTARNVVPAEAACEFDLRLDSLAAWHAVESGLAGLRPRLAGATVRVDAALTHPPMERTEAIGALHARARPLAAEAGIDLTEGGTGGGSDGSFCAAAGVPVLDGLGVEGEGAHAESERVRVEMLAPRGAFLGLLLERVEGP